MAAAGELETTHQRSDAAPAPGALRGGPGWLIQVLCLAFAVFVLSADVGYTLWDAGLEPRAGALGASFEGSARNGGFVRVANIKPGGALAREGVVAGDRVLVQTTVQPTNDVTYLRGIRTTSHVPADLKPYLPLYASVRTDEHCDGPAGPPLTCFRRDPCRPGADVDGHQGTVQGGVHPRLGNGVRRRHRLADPHAVA